MPFKTITITTTELSNLAGMPLQSKLIKNLGIQPFAQTKTGVYWATEDVPDMTPKPKIESDSDGPEDQEAIIISEKKKIDEVLIQSK